MSNLFDSSAQVWVNPVNCVGVMGKGIAKQFAIRFPDMLNYYEHACKVEKSIRPGTIYTVPHAPAPPNWIVLLATKDHWRDSSKLAWVIDGLDNLAHWCKDEGITSLAIPAIGCGLGNLDWSVVRPLIFDRLGFIPGLEVYEPK